MKGNWTFSDNKVFFTIYALDSLHLDSISILNFLEKLKLYYKAEYAVYAESDGNNVNIDYLSEGQRQLIKVVGMLGICKSEDCLVLMDEPDVYMNPRWKYEIKEIIAFYDMRTNMESFGKTRQLKKSDFEEFIEGYKDASKRTGERWSKFTREQIENEHDDSLDLGLIKDDSIIDAEELPNPIESGEEAIAQLEEAVDLLKSVVRKLKTLTLED